MKDIPLITLITLIIPNHLLIHLMQLIKIKKEFQQMFLIYVGNQI